MNSVILANVYAKVDEKIDTNVTLMLVSKVAYWSQEAFSLA